MSLRSLRSLEDEARERSAQLSGENRFFFPEPSGMGWIHHKDDLGGGFRGFFPIETDLSW